MRTRTSIVLGAAGVALLVAACVPPSNPPPTYYGPPPPQQAQPADPAQPEPYQPQPQPEPYQPPAPAPAPAPPQPEPVAEPYPPPEGPVYVDIQAADVAGDEVPTVEVFYDQLDPYGTWYDDRTYGWVFAPSQASYVPYANGYWKNTEFPTPVATRTFTTSPPRRP